MRAKIEMTQIPFGKGAAPSGFLLLCFGGPVGNAAFDQARRDLRSDRRRHVNAGPNGSRQRFAATLGHGKKRYPQAAAQRLGYARNEKGAVWNERRDRGGSR